MATLTCFPSPDYQDSLGTNRQGSITTGSSSGAITLGQHRLIHISALSGTTVNRCALSYTLGLSTGTTAPTPTASSPFFLGDEGYVVDTGQYDQINLANIAAYNGAVTVRYSLTLLSKF